MAEKAKERNRFPNGSIASCTEQECTGHVAWHRDRKICAKCATHIDYLRPPESGSDD